MSAPWDSPRTAFHALRSNLEADSELAGELKQCLTLLLTRYNTQIYENRFLVGGVVERIIAAVFVALGDRARTVGVEVTRTDIHVGGCSLSVKGSFRPKPRTIRLINVMGNSPDALWKEPTIFVISKCGIGYADPGLLPSATIRAADALELKVRPLLDLWEAQSKYFIPIDLPYSRDQKEGSDVASRIVADELLRYTTRLRPFDRRTPCE